MKPSKKFVALDKSRHNRRDFDCGVPELNTFVREFALRHRKAGISKTMVLPAEAPANEIAPICAFYTLSHTEIARTSLPQPMPKKLPRYPIPVMLLAQLAVDRQCQGQHLGEVTLVTALRDALAINRHLPSYAVVVDAIQPGVEEFYKQYGFLELETRGERTRLFIPMATVSQLD